MTTQKERPSWKASSSKKPRGTTSGYWKEKATHGRPLVTPQQTRFFIALSVLLILVTAMVVYIIRMPKSVPFFAVDVTAYPIQVPPNSLAREDLERMDQHLAEADDIRFGWNTEELNGGVSAKLLRDRLKQFLTGPDGTPGGPNRTFWRTGGALIFYVSAHGAVNEDGEPCLLLKDFRPLESDTWFRVQDLLDTIMEVTSPSSKKLLILDSGRMHEEWGIGVFHNGFAELLEDLLLKKEYRQENFYVLNSTRKGQHSFRAPELGGSVFGYFVTRGILGDANLTDFGGDERDGVSLRELGHFVTSQVANWVRVNRAAVQQPILLPSSDEEAKDFGLAHVSGKKSINTKQQATNVLRISESRQRKVDSSSAAFAKLEDDGAYRFDPSRWASLQHHVKRANQLVFAGKAYDDQFKSITDRIDDFILALSKTNSSLPSSASLALQENLPRQRLGSPQTRQLWTEYLKSNFHLDQETALQNIPYTELAAAGWRVLTDPSFLQQISTTPELVTNLQALRKIPTIAKSDAPEFDSTEIHFAKLLLQCVDWETQPNLQGDMRPICLDLLSARDDLERIAAPSDPRVHYWLTEPIYAADRYCNTAQDLLFIGSAIALERARSQLVAGAAARDLARKISTEVEDAYLTRDKACAKLPHLWAWLIAARNSAPELVGQSWRNLANDLRDLTKEVQNLSNIIEGRTAKSTSAAESSDSGDARESQRGFEDPVIDADEFSSRQKAAEKRLAGLNDSHNTTKRLLERVEEEFKRWSADLTEISVGQTAEKIQRILTRIEVPLNVESQGELQQSLDLEKTIGLRLIRHLQNSIGNAPILTTERNDDLSNTPDGFYYSWLSEQPAHPALRLLDQNASDASRSQDRREQLLAWAKSGSELRKRLSMIAPSGSGSYQAIKETNVSELTNPISAKWPANTVRHSLADADRMVRVAASWLQWDVDGPSQELWKMDSHFLLLWHAQRRLDDFWGSPVNSEHGLYYFSEAAKDHIGAAEGLLQQKIRIETKENQNPFCDRLDLATRQLEKSRREWNPFIMEQIVRSPTGNTRLEHRIILQEQKGIPAGFAAIFLNSLVDGKLLEVEVGGEFERRRAALVSATQDSNRDLLHRLAIDIKQVRDYEAIALYRGHKVDRRLDQKRGVEIRFERPGPSRIKVIGDNRNIVHEVVFVFDCSKSMDKNNNNLFNPAKNALINFIPALMNDQIRAGLICYGHRVGYGDQNSPRRTGNPQFHPSSDVEVVFKLNMLTESLADEWRSKIKGLRSRGRTPLYLSISDALDQFSKDRAQVKRHVIVLTDGVNNDEPHKLDPEKPPRKVTQEQLIGKLELAAKDGIRVTQVDVIGMKISSDNIDRLREITKKADGSYEEAEDAESIEQALRDLLGIPKFYVNQVADPPSETEEVKELGRLAEIPYSPKMVSRRVGLIDGKGKPLLDKRGNAIKIEGVKLEGDETVVLEAPRDSPEEYPQDLRFQRFVHGDERNDLQGKPIDHPKYSIHPLAGLVGNGSAYFRIAIQLKDTKKYTQRPRFFWTEIRPLVRNKHDGNEYFFYDPKFVQKTGVPVFELTASDWPTNANKAEVRFWFVEPGTKVEAETQKLPILPHRENIKFKRIANVEFRLEVPDGNLANDRIIVNEIHSANSKQFPLHVTIGGLSLRSIYHAYGQISKESENMPRTIRHEFEFPSGTLEQANIDRSLTLRIAPNQRVKEAGAANRVEFTLNVLR